MSIFTGLFKKKIKYVGHHCTMVIPAAGSSRRMGGENKLFMQLDGIPVLARTLMAVESAECVDDIIIAARPDDMDAVAAICRDYNITKASKVVTGGDTRTESVYEAVFEASKKSDIIGVHDGARPLVTADIIDKAYRAAVKFSAAAPAVPVKDTVKIARGGVVKSTPDRNTLFAVQTPQMFNAVIFKAAMENAVKKGLELSDDCMAVEAISVKPRLTEGSYENIKITTAEDIALAEAIVRARNGENEE